MIIADRERRMNKCIWEQTRYWEEEGWVTQCNGEFTLIGKEDPDMYEIEYCPFCGLEIEVKEDGFD